MKLNLEFEVGALMVPREVTLRLSHRQPGNPFSQGFMQPPPAPPAPPSPATSGFSPSPSGYGQTMYNVPINALSVEQLTAVCNRFQKDLFTAAGHPVTCIRPTTLPELSPAENSEPVFQGYLYDKNTPRYTRLYSLGGKFIEEGEFTRQPRHFSHKDSFDIGVAESNE